MMDPTTGLLPGQSWSVAPSDAWQARIGRGGRAHVIGRELAGHPAYGVRYADECLSSRHRRGWYPERWPTGDTGWANGTPFWSRIRPWHTFERACRAARMHSRIVIAVRRQEQGGDA